MERKRWSDNLRNFLINATTKETKEDDQRRKVKFRVIGGSRENHFVPKGNILCIHFYFRKASKAQEINQWMRCSMTMKVKKVTSTFQIASESV